MLKNQILQGKIESWESDRYFTNTVYQRDTSNIKTKQTEETVMRCYILFNHFKSHSCTKSKTKEKTYLNDKCKRLELVRPFWKNVSIYSLTTNCRLSLANRVEKENTWRQGKELLCKKFTIFQNPVITHVPSTKYTTSSINFELKKML